MHRVGRTARLVAIGFGTFVLSLLCGPGRPRSWLLAAASLRCSACRRYYIPCLVVLVALCEPGQSVSQSTFVMCVWSCAWPALRPLLSRI